MAKEVLRNFNFPHTKEAVKHLLVLLQCHHCSRKYPELYTLKQCDHQFCRSCAENKVGRICPICDMPSHLSHAHKDKQLSNISSLCMQVSNILNGVQSTESTVCLSDKSSETQAGEKGKPANQKHSDKEKNQRGFGGTNGFDTVDGGQESPNGLQSATKPSRKNVALIKSKSSERTDQLANKSIEQSDCVETVNAFKWKGDKKESSEPSRSSKKLTRNQLRHLDEESKLSPVLGMTVKSEVINGETSSISSPTLQKQLKGPANIGTPVIKKKSSKAHLYKRNAKGETSLQIAVIKADVKNVQKLLEQGANPNVRDNAGWTPLHEAVNHGLVEVAELLIMHGAAVNTPGMDNDTPLHDAVVNSRIECAKLLIAKGANVMARNVYGRTPLDLAWTDEIRRMCLEASNGISFSNDGDESMVTESDDDQPLCFLGTAMTREDQGILMKCSKLLNAKVVDEMAPEVTHFITDVDADGVCSRTLKYLQAILAGTWIVNKGWLYACLEHGMKVSEEPYEIAGCSTNSTSSAPYKARQNRQKQLPGLFDGCQVFFHGKFKYPTRSKEELTSLVKLGGGAILTREPRLHNLDDYPYTIPYHASTSNTLVDCTIFVIYDDACLQPPYVEAQRMSCLPARWLVDSITSFCLLEKSDYLKSRDHVQ